MGEWIKDKQIAWHFPQNPEAPCYRCGQSEHTLYSDAEGLCDVKPFDLDDLWRHTKSSNKMGSKKMEKFWQDEVLTGKVLITDLVAAKEKLFLEQYPTKKERDEARKWPAEPTPAKPKKKKNRGRGGGNAAAANTPGTTPIIPGPGNPPSAVQDPTSEPVDTQANPTSNNASPSEIATAGLQNLSLEGSPSSSNQGDAPSSTAQSSSNSQPNTTAPSSAQTVLEAPRRSTNVALENRWRPMPGNERPLRLPISTGPGLNDLSQHLYDIFLQDDTATDIHARRRQFCNVGVSVPVLTNHFLLELPKKQFYVYSIGVFNNTTPRAKKRELIQDLINLIPELSARRNSFATDWHSIIIAWEPIGKHERDNPRVDDIVAQGRVDVYIDSKGVKKFTDLSVTYKRQFNTASLQQYISGDQNAIRFTSEVLQIEKDLNIVLGKAAESSHPDYESFSFGKKYYRKCISTQNVLQPCLYATPSCYFTIKACMGNALLNVNVGMSPFLQATTVSYFLENYEDEGGDRIKWATTDWANKRGVNAVEKALLGTRVYIVYNRKDHDNTNKINDRGRRLKTINGFGRPPHQQTYYDDETKKTRSVAEYYAENVVNLPGNSNLFPDGNILGDHLPCVNVGGKRQGEEKWIAPAYLGILPYQRLNQKLNSNMTTRMIGMACRAPDTTKQEIFSNALRTLGILDQHGNINTNATVLDHNNGMFKITPNFLEIPGRRLFSPSIQYQGSQTEGPKAATAQWNLGAKKFREGGDSTIKFHFVFDPRCNKKLNNDAKRDSVINLVHNELVKGNYGLNIGERNDHSKRSIPSFMVNDVRAAIKAAKPDTNSTTVVVLVLFKKDQRFYSSFKAIVDTELGFQSLCINYATLETQSKRGSAGQYVGNLAMKLNLKVGGKNHHVKHVLDQLEDTIVLGADVTHAGVGSVKGTPSIAAVVGSVDSNCGKLLGSMTLQSRETNLGERIEMIQHMTDMVRQRIEAWSKANSKGNLKRYPKKVLYYRDGVGQSQYQKFREEELKGIRDAFENLPKEYRDPKITAVVVEKRHHTRFFPVNAKDKVPFKSDNVPNGNFYHGLCVDSHVTSPYYFDFYIQSHHGLKGTARPAHYFVVENGMDFEASVLQQLTYRLCFTYVRATLGVSYAPPAYYADRLCERGRCYLRSYLVPDPDNKPDDAPAPPTALGENADQELRMEYDAAMRNFEVEKRQWLDQLEGACWPQLPRGNGFVNGPWRPSLDDTMFWM